MAFDDMEVIMYKVLRYLYACNKEGRYPAFEDYCYNGKMFHVPQSYWNQVIRQIIKKGYVDGFAVITTKDQEVIQPTQPQITFDGIQFLKENSRMKAVENFLGNAFEIVLQSMVAALVKKEF